MSRTDKADWKIVWIFCGMLAVCSLLMMRIYLLSMSSGLQQAAAEQSSYTLTVTTTRGRIYDRRMQPLTDTEQHDLIAVLPPHQAAQGCAKQIEGTARRAALDRIAQGTPFLLDITGKDGEREKVYSQDVENITTAARLPHDPTEQRAVHLLGYRDSEGKGLTGIERAFDSRLEKAGEPGAGALSGGCAGTRAGTGKDAAGRECTSAKGRSGADAGQPDAADCRAGGQPDRPRCGGGDGGGQRRADCLCQLSKL